MSLGALAFLNPWLLAGLVALPIIYLLLRAVPPRPQQVAFPPTRILVGLENPEKTPVRTPWWLMLIRMIAAALVILALAEPVLNPNRETALKGSGPVVIVVDNGWASASRWPNRVRLLESLIAEAEGQSRPIVVMPTATTAKALTARLETPTAARSTAAALEPHPFEPQRSQALAALETVLANQRDSSIVWLADGIDHDLKTRTFAEGLSRLAGAGLAVVESPAGEEALGATGFLGKEGRLEAAVLRAGGVVRDGFLHAYSVRGQRLGEAPFRFAPGETVATSRFELPLELRNQVTRIEVAGERSAGAVGLLDARSQWLRVGILSGESRELAQPLLAPLYYIQKGLGPFAELVQPKDSNLAAGIETVLKQNASVLILADIGTLSGDVKRRVEDWVKKGGVLVRFAGPRLEKGGDDLIPVALRHGGRTLGGALSWSTPQPLAPFADDSLFTGLAVPAEILVTRQVLADPAHLGPQVKIWARLKDGTPLVTAAKRGEGQIVLFHVTANADWSNLPISGLFVEMLRRLTTLGKLAGGTEAAALDAGETASVDASVLAPIQVLDGFGSLRSPPPTAKAVKAGDMAQLKPSADHPPGYYGLQSVPRALNLMGPKSELKPLPPLPAGTDRRLYHTQAATPLKPAMLAAALALLLVDIIAILLLQTGGFVMRRPRARAAAGFAVAVFAAALLAGTAASAQTPPPARQPERRAADDAGQKVTGIVTFGYVVTGDAGVDNTSRLGLMGLGKKLIARTAVEPGEPFGVNIATDEIAFFPLLYWPVLADAQPLPEPTLAKIDAYMKQGGMIIFDTRDYGLGMPSGLPLGGRDGPPLQRLLGRLDIPRLEPVHENHVLTKSYYL
ncbi:MAG: DUF4159 domain-containing protein, partial [Hyphomicrobiaceae bacterium]